MNKTLCLCVIAPLIAVYPALAKPSPTLKTAATFTSGSFVGGSEHDDVAAIATTADGDSVVCGSTMSLDLATAGAAYETHADANTVPAAFTPLYSDAFVAKVSATTGELVFATYFGGAETDVCRDVKVDSEGNIVITGVTASNDFPVVNAFDSTFAGGTTGSGDGADGFVAKLSADGSTVLFSTYLGGLDDRTAFGIENMDALAIGDDNSIYVAGTTNSPDFPSTALINGRSCLEDGLSSTIRDMTVTRLSASGDLLYSSCFGGNINDQSRAIAVNQTGNVVVAGHTSSTDLVLPANAYTDLPDAFIGQNNILAFELDLTTSTLVGALHIGGEENDFTADLTLAPNGSIVIAGSSNSSEFPVTANAFQPNVNGTHDPSVSTFSYDGLILSVNPTMTAINFATYVGSSLDFQTIGDIEIDELGQIWFALEDSSDELPSISSSIEAQPATFSGEMLQGVETTGTNEVAIARTFSSAHSALFLRNGQNYATRVDPLNVHTARYHSFGPATGDSRALAFESALNGNVIVGNFGSENELYATFTTPLVTFGDATGPTTDIAWAGDWVAEALEGEANALYLVNDTGLTTFTEVDSFGAAGDITVDLESYNDGFVEALQPNILRFYRADSATNTMTLVQEVTLNGVNIAQMRASSTTVYGNGTKRFLLVSNSAGPSEIIYLPSGFDSNVQAGRVAIDPLVGSTSSMQITRTSDNVQTILAASDGVLTQYSFNPALPETPVKIGEYPSTLSDGLLGRTNSGALPTLVPIASPSGQAVTRHRGAVNTYLGAINATGSQLVYGKLLGGAGEDACPCSLSLAAAGELALATNTAASTVAEVGGTNTGKWEPYVVRLDYPLDDDMDAVSDLTDNCQLVANPLQQDVNDDGYGNACDPDLDDNMVVNFADIAAFVQAFGSTDADANWNPAADFNSDGAINFLDFSIIPDFFLGSPGPAANQP